ncbi:MAG: putative bifunctional diguanylate cyclase/phosphodiesterase [Acidimicrobiales bacterium]
MTDHDGSRSTARGVRGSAPPHVRRGLRLLGLAATTIVAGSAIGLRADAERVGPTVLDLPSALAWVFAVVGVLSLIGGRQRGRQLDSVVEAMLVTVPVAYLAIPAVLDDRPTTVSAAAGMVTIAVIAADVILVVLAAELLRLQQRRRPVSALLVLAGACCILGLHAARAGILLGGGTTSGRSDLAVLLGVLPALLWLAASLHPDGRLHDGPMATSPTALTPLRVGIVAVAVAVGPVVLALRTNAGRTEDLLTLTVGAIAVAGVAVAYLVRLVEQRARIEYLALHDDLCGIPNRVLLGDRIASALAQAPREGSRVALLFLDLDRFKTINDSLGHAAGNDLLRAAATRLTETVRSGDTVARLGGDEFAVLLPGVDDPDTPATVAEKVLDAFRVPFEIAGRQLFVSPSIGVSLHPDDARDAEELLRNADAAMYRAKENGRNTFELYTRALNERAHQRLSLESSLHKAVEREELVMHYQPKVDLRSGQIVGMEALMRWEHPELGQLLPGEFIPLAEENGLIVPLGEWALEQACRQTRAWADEGHTALTVAVNLSARQFQHQEVGDMVARVLRLTGLDPASLELELTESLVLQDPEAVMATLHDLKAMGVKCSIDDFGTGYSGLQYLTRFPIDKLKIDRFFVSEISNGGGNARIVAAVIALAHGLRLEVIAEGVESDEQRRFLLEHGCDEMQGFLFSQAIPAMAFEALLPGLPVHVSPAGASHSTVNLRPASAMRSITPSPRAVAGVRKPAPSGTSAPGSAIASAASPIMVAVDL